MSDAVCFIRHGLVYFQWEIKTVTSIAETLGKSKENLLRRNVGTLLLKRGGGKQFPFNLHGQKGTWVCASWLCSVNQEWRHRL